MKKLFLTFMFLQISIEVYSQSDYHQKVDSVLILLRKTNEENRKAELFNQLYNYYSESNSKKEKDSAGYYAFQSVRLSRKTGNKKCLADALYCMAKFNISATNKFSEATPNLLESLTIFEQLKDSFGISKCYLQLGLISLTLQYYEDAIKKMKIANHYNRNSTAKYLMAICYSELDSLKMAKQYFEEVMQECYQKNYRERLVECHIYIGKMYVSKGELDSGFYYLRQAIKAIELRNDSVYLARPFAFISKAYLMKNDIKNAIYYATISFHLAKNHSDEISLFESSSTLSKAYKLNGDYKNAYFFLNELNILKDTIFNGSTKQKVADMQSNFEFEKMMNAQTIRQEKDKEIAHQQIQKEKIIKNSFIAGSILLLLFLAVIYNRFTIKRDANLVLEDKNKIILYEKERSDNLLLNILPSEVAEELKRTGESIAKQYDHVTVLFTDFVNFTGISEEMSPKELVNEIHKNFTAFDSIIEKYGLEKIKTIGDAYLAVCGMPNETVNHGQQVIKAALEIQSFIRESRSKFQIRIGINSGPVVAGIVGIRKYAYDIWGDTVNTAARMEQHSEPGKINISGSTYNLIKDQFKCTYRGKIEAKNKGEIDMYFVDELIM